MPSDLGSLITSYGTRPVLRLTSGSSKRRPMKRLMLKIVFSGLVIAWRFATWPTSRSPLLAKATTDGVIRPPSALVMTCGSPPSMTATTELVVPRSMPMILPIVSSMLLWVVRHSDEARPDHPVVQPIAALHLADHFVIRMRGGLLVSHRLVEVRVERQSDRLDLGHALRLEDAAELALHELDALDPRVVGLGRHVLERPVEVVEHAEQPADQHRGAELAELRALVIGPALVVAEVGGRSLPVVQVLLGLRRRRRQLALELLD